MDEQYLKDHLIQKKCDFYSQQGYRIFEGKLGVQREDRDLYEEEFTASRRAKECVVLLFGVIDGVDDDPSREVAELCPNLSLNLS